MKVLILTFFAILATSFAAADDACENGAETCIDGLLNAIISDSSEEEKCKELRTSIDCLQNFVEDCRRDESGEEFKDVLKLLDNFRNENLDKCGGSQESVSEDKHEEKGKCLVQNGRYIPECSKERFSKAFEILLTKDDVNEDPLKCTGQRASIDCLQNVVENCLGDESGEELEYILILLEYMGNEMLDNCGGNQESVSDDELEGMGKCFEENKDYLRECIEQGTLKAIFLTEDDVNEDTKICTLYGTVAGCFVERIGEKCGETAARTAKEGLSRLPVEIRDACEAAGSLDPFDIQLWDKKIEIALLE